MGGGETRSTQTTTQSMPAGQQRNVDTMLRAALDYFNTGGRSFYPGDLVADFDPLQTQGQNALVNFAGGVGTDLANEAISSNRFFMDPNNIFNPQDIPGFQNVLDSIVTNSIRGLTEGILPSIRASGTASGQFGGSAMGIGEALATDRTTENIANSIGQANLGAYGLGLNSFNQAMNRAPALFGLGMMPGQVISGVGDARQAQNQNEIQADVARHEFEQNEPMLQLQLLRDLTGSYGQYGGTTNTEATQKTKSSPVNQVLGGALSLASMWNPMTSLFAGLGKTAMPGIGGLFSSPASPNIFDMARANNFGS